MDPQTADTPRWTTLQLLLASSVALFQELALIRWLPGEVRVVAYFPNLILIGAFLGLGVGSLRARGRSLLWLWPLSVAAVVGAGAALSGVAFTAEGISEHLWLLYDDLPESAPVVEGVRLPLLLLFVLTVVSFIPLGQVVGDRLQDFKAARRPLRGYALDLGGSFVGVVGFAWISFGWLGPLWWFVPFLLAGAVLVHRRRGVLALHVACSLLVLAVVVRADDAELYSPYYALSTTTDEGLPEVLVRTNGSLHQVAVDFQAPELGSEARQRTIVGYGIPHRLLGRPIRKALVLGAGTGNDVAVLLQAGAAEIHAVEIDPAIIQLGRERHPNAPYRSDRVVVHNTDARSFLNETEERFDFIVFGTLDSMTRLSALSNVRLDNFVYTREALAGARGLLTEDGAMVLYFMVGEEYIHQHLMDLMTVTFGRLPTVRGGEYSLFNAMYMSGPGFDHIYDAPPELEAWYLDERLPVVDIPSDDWPYLYLPEKSVSTFYLGMMALLALVAVLTVFGTSPEMRASLGRGAVMDTEMFLYGLAFLLIETKFVTAMNLLWGATWITSAVVFGAILFTVLTVTLAADRWPVRWQAAGVGLVVALLAVYFVPLQPLARSDMGLKLLLSTLYVGAPVAFAAFCFADRFSTRENAGVAFGWNLLGAVFGGLIEFFSMSLGFKALTLVAMLAYLGAFLLAVRNAGSGADAREGTALPPPTPAS